MKQLAVIALALGVFGSGPPRPADAGCGCDKPPPQPAAILPPAAFPGMPVTLFSPHLRAGQQWSVRFQSGATTQTVAATVVVKRALTDPSGQQYTPQLVVTVPEVAVGPTRIEASTTTASLTVLENAFTVIGKPVLIAERTMDFSVQDYQTAVGADGTLYLSVSGLDTVCQAMSFGAQLTEYPLQFGSGDIVIRNSQGFLIDLLDWQAADHFATQQGSQGRSSEFYYFRHSFAQYCRDHRPGGRQEVDPQDPNWHRDGTLHTDYSTLIFALAGKISGQSPTPGPVVSDVIVTTSLGSGTEAWERESEEEHDDEDEEDSKENGDHRDASAYGKRKVARASGRQSRIEEVQK